MRFIEVGSRGFEIKKYVKSKGAEMATRMEEILMTGNQLEYCKALDNYVLDRSERLPLPIGTVS